MSIPAKWSVIQSDVEYPCTLVGVVSGGSVVQTDVIDGLLSVDGVQAAQVFGWGALLPSQSDEFNGTSVDTVKWAVYNGPGNGGQGVRDPAQITVSNGSLFINGLANGTTGGMLNNEYKMYGRWEVRMRIPAGDEQYHPLALLFPETQIVDWPQGGEVDFAETSCANTQQHFFLHYDVSNLQVSSAITLDLTKWHNYAVEWTASHIRGWADGVLFFECTDVAKLPLAPQHLCLQLDWVPATPYVSTVPSSMEVAWVRAYSI